MERLFTFLCIVVGACLGGALTYGMWWLYFRLVPRVSAWMRRKLGL